MKSIAVVLALLSFRSVSAWGADADSVPLPDEPDSVVLELAFREAGDREARPAVRIRADGAVVVPAKDTADEPLHGSVPPDRLQALLEEVVTNHQFFELRSDRLLQEVHSEAERSGRSWRVARADVTVIRIRLKDRRHEVVFPAAELLHERFPEVDSLARLVAVQRRLQNVRAIVQAGGFAAAERYVEAANDELRAQVPHAPPVTVGDLLMVRTAEEGMRYLQFVSVPSPEEAGPLLVSVFEFAEEPLRVSVTPLSEPSR